MVLLLSKASKIIVYIKIIIEPLYYFLFHTIFLFISIGLFLFRKPICNFLSINDLPNNQRKVHEKPMNTIGGMIIFINLILSLSYLLFYSEIKIKIFLILIFIYSLFFLLGLVDDNRQLSAKLKTFLIFLFLFIVLPLDNMHLIKNIKISNFDKVIVLNEGALFFTIFCIYFFYNAVNFADGLNGVCTSLVLFWLIAIFFNHGGDANEPGLISLIICILLILFLNVSGKLFIGNSGSSLLSIIVSIFFIKAHNDSNIYFDEIVILVLLPAIDVIRVSIERVLKKKSPFVADTNHFHHLLMNKFGKKIIFIPYIFISATPYLFSRIYNVSNFFIISIFIVMYFALIKILQKC
jgi:UDP-GlcNAc:undecaprenyl-phosphate/decaprenyl-phosphate GlcNAc-1-phosphate transferase